jgi:PAS domain S-box-containing protein
MMSSKTEALQAEIAHLRSANARRSAELDDAKRVDDALREKEALYLALLDDSSDPIFALTKDGVYLYINNAFGDQIKRSPDDVIGRNLWDVFPKAAADQRFAGLQAVLESRQTKVIEVVAEEGGKKTFFITTIKPMQKKLGPPDAVLCISKDITDRKNAEDELRRLNQHLELRVAERTAELFAANEQLRAEIAERKRAEEEHKWIEAELQQARKMEAVGRLAGSVAHDFNNMLGVIRGNTDLAIMELPATSPVHEHLGEIATACARSADLTRQLLAFASRQVIAPTVLQVNSTIESMLKMLRRLMGKKVRLHWTPAVDVWPVKMDPVQIDQILLNLVVNARDAIGGAGNVMIATENRILDMSHCDHYPNAMAGQYMQLVVRDDGCGMDREVVGHMFEPFFTTKEPGKGTGIGLATVYGIVKQNNGFILVNSERGKGTEFQVCLPRYHSADAAASA